MSNFIQFGCAFCRRNKEPEAVYRSHQLKDKDGKVVCPQLFKYRCELCGSTGHEAHTRSYCPLVVKMRHQTPTPSLAESNGQINSSSSSSSSLISNPIGYNSYQNLTSSINISRGGIFRNMGRVSNSRYNSAGRLRNPNANSIVGRNHQQRQLQSNQYEGFYYNNNNNQYNYFSNDNDINSVSWNLNHSTSSINLFNNNPNQEQQDNLETEKSDLAQQNYYENSDFALNSI